MRAVLQRVKYGKCTVEGEVTGRIDRGLVILLGVGPQDTQVEVEALTRKIARLRIFADETGKMNLNITDAGGAHV